MKGYERHIGVIINNRTDVFQRDVLTGITEMAAESGYQVKIDALAESGALRPIALDLSGVSGLIVVANIVDDALLLRLHNAGVRITLISHAILRSRIPAVIANNTQGIALLMQHLVTTCGRRRIVFVRGDMGQSDGRERSAAFARECLRYQLPPASDLTVAGDFQPALARAAVTERLAQRPDFDAILAADYLTALAAWDAVRAAGLRVPDDIQIAGFGDGHDAQRAGLTTVAADVVEQGRRGMRQLLAQIGGVSISGVTLLRTHLLKRDSTCPSGLSHQK
jgi:DNA-binding LacI/PurR family transcriptional regulator